MKNVQPAIPLYELEAPGWERSRLSFLNFMLLALLSIVVFVVIVLITASHTLFRKTDQHMLRDSTTSLKIVYKKNS